MNGIKQLSIRPTGLIAGLLTLAGLFATLGCSSSSSPTSSGGGPVFTPNAVSVNVGDTVKWVGVSGSHTVTSGAGASDPNVGKIFDHTLNAGQVFSFVFTSAGVTSYFCRPHEAMGMKGTVTVSAVAPKTVNVTTSGISFSPANVSINVGDKVHWTSTGSHTVTSGTGLSDPSAGALFDQSIPSGSAFDFTFTAPGVYHYFCRPHVSLGMTGTVTVTAVKPKSVQVNATS